MAYISNPNEIVQVRVPGDEWERFDGSRNGLPTDWTIRTPSNNGWDSLTGRYYPIYAGDLKKHIYTPDGWRQLDYTQPVWEIVGGTGFLPIQAEADGTAIFTLTDKKPEPLCPTNNQNPVNPTNNYWAFIVMSTVYGLSGGQTDDDSEVVDTGGGSVFKVATAPPQNGSLYGLCTAVHISEVNNDLQKSFTIRSSNNDGLSVRRCAYATFAVCPGESWQNADYVFQQRTTRSSVANINASLVIGRGYRVSETIMIGSGTGGSSQNMRVSSNPNPQGVSYQEVAKSARGVIVTRWWDDFVNAQQFDFTSSINFGISNIDYTVSVCYTAWATSTEQFTSEEMPVNPGLQAMADNIEGATLVSIRGGKVLNPDTGQYDIEIPGVNYEDLT